MSRPRAGRPEAAEVVWRWRSRPGSESPGQSPSRSRLLGCIQGGVGVGLAAAVYLLWSQNIGMVIFSISTIILFSALASPLGLYRIIQGIFETLGAHTGRALTWLTLVPLFYLFFLPFGLLFRRGRRDRMKRFFERDEESYWEPHKEFSAADHERQF